MMRSGPYHRSVGRPAMGSGFTMVEVLVAMGVTFVMVVFFLTLTSNAFKQWNRSVGLMTTENEAALIMDYLEQDLGSAIMQRDGRVWLAATIQPDQTSVGDTRGLSESSTGIGQTLNFTNWLPAPGGTMKPGGMTSPYTPNALGSSLFIPAYIAPLTATQSSLTTSATGSGGPSNLPDLTAFRFGQAGVWLRMFTPVPDSNDGKPKNTPSPRAVSYQIVRSKSGTTSTSYRYHLFRSTVRPFGDTANTQSKSTFGAGFDFFQVFASTNTAAFGMHTTTVSIYNNPSAANNPGGNGANGGGGGLAQDDAGNIRQPNVNQVIADNVIDFGVLFWGRTFDSTGREMYVLLFPSSKNPASRPNLGFAVTTEDGFTRRDNNGRLIPAMTPASTNGTSSTGWGQNGLQTVNAMTYGFAWPTRESPGVPDRPCTPAYADVFVRILDEEGARLIDAYENVPEGSVQITHPTGVTAGEYWWQIATQHSHVYTRRIQLKGAPM